MDRFERDGRPVPPTPDELAQRLRLLTGRASAEPSAVAEPSGEPRSGRESDASAGPPGTQRRVGGPQVLVLAACVLVALALALVQLAGARAVEVPTTQVSVELTPAASTAPSQAPSAAQLVVHVIGAVAAPGVVRLPVGARVADAIAAAGGLSSDAELGTLNLAQPLSDGAQVQVGTPTSASTISAGGSVGTGTAAGASGARVSLNRATADELDALPGVGPVTVQKIIDRRARQPFTRVEELQEIDGIGQKTYARLAELVTI